MGILIFTAKYCSEQDLNQVLKLMTINNIHQGIYNIVSLTATNSEISGILTATISRAIYSPPTSRDLLSDPLSSWVMVKRNLSAEPGFHWTNTFRKSFLCSTFLVC